MTTGLLKPCLDCGEPAQGSRCPAHTTEANRRPWEHRREREREYNRADWRRLSKRARSLQDVCLEPGEHKGPLTAHHLASAWDRRAKGLPLRLLDVQVMCLRHNDQVGQTRPG